MVWQTSTDTKKKFIVSLVVLDYLSVIFTVKMSTLPSGKKSVLAVEVVSAIFLEEAFAK